MNLIAISKMGERLNYNAIPNELKQLNQWACFFLVWDKENNKYKKVIVNANTGKAAYCNDSSTWTSFEQAKSICKRKGYKGLVFALTKGITFIDIDHAIDKKTGEIASKEANELLEIFRDTFTEKSVSGTGLHILVKGSLPENAKKKNDEKGIEMYDTARFICMTGNSINDCAEIADYSHIIKDINHKYIGVRKERTASDFNTKCQLGDTELIEKISNSKQGEKFTKLYNGDMSGYATHSNADYALVSIISWWTQDFGQIDRIFRSSALMRDKWDRRCNGSTYGANIIDSLLGSHSSCRRTYTSSYSM